MNKRFVLFIALLATAPVLASDEQQEIVKNLFFTQEGLVLPHLNEETNFSLVSKDFNKRLAIHKNDQINDFKAKFPAHNPNRKLRVWVKRSENSSSLVNLPFSSLLFGQSGNYVYGLTHNTVPLQQLKIPLKSILNAELKPVEHKNKSGQVIKGEEITVSGASVVNYDMGSEPIEYTIDTPCFDCVVNENKQMRAVYVGSKQNNNVKYHKVLVGNHKKYSEVNISLPNDQTPFLLPNNINGSIEVWYQSSNGYKEPGVQINRGEYQFFDISAQSWKAKEEFKPKKSTNNTCVIS